MAIKLKTGLSDTIMQLVDVLSIDDVLRCLVRDSDLEEVVCCLDFIAQEDGKKVEMYENGIRVYPVS